MTRLPSSSQIPAAGLGRRRAARWLGVVMALGVLSAQAAVTQAGSSDTSAPAMGAGTRTLDKALGGELTTGDRNLDLLLETQRQGADRVIEAPTSQPIPDRPAAARPGLQPLPQGATAVPAPVAPEAVRRYQPSLALPEQGQLGNAGLPTPKSARDWGGGAGLAGAGSVAGRVSVQGDTSRLPSGARPLQEWLQEGVAFLKDHAVVIVLAGAAIALLVMGLKAYSRRI